CHIPCIRSRAVLFPTEGCLMAIANHTRKRLNVTASNIALTVIALGMLIPMFWMAFTSFKPDGDIFTSTPLQLPEALTTEHYSNLFSEFHFGTSFVNSVLIAVATVVTSVVVGGLGGYGFARY